jgi:hypothetical protein
MGIETDWGRGFCISTGFCSGNPSSRPTATWLGMRGVEPLDVVSRMSVLLCLGLYEYTTTALSCAMHDKIQSIR